MVELIVQHVQNGLTVIMPWLVGMAIGFFALWLSMLCYRAKPFEKELRWFCGLAPLHRLIVVCAICLFTI